MIKGFLVQVMTLIHSKYQKLKKLQKTIDKTNTFAR